MDQIYDVIAIRQINAVNAINSMTNMNIVYRVNKNINLMTGSADMNIINDHNVISCIKLQSGNMKLLLRFRCRIQLIEYG